MELSMEKNQSNQYDKKYFDWQQSMGNFGGWANVSKFEKFIKPEDTVLDFGAGGGYLLSNLKCQRKIGLEINVSAHSEIKRNGAEAVSSLEKISNESIDTIISSNALEHTLHPLNEIKHLYEKLKPNGKIIFVVPCENISYSYVPWDINHHLYSWSPMCLGNLFSEAGFHVLESKPFIHKWPPHFRAYAKFGRKIFDICCRIYGRIERTWFQVRIVAEKKSGLNAIPLENLNERKIYLWGAGTEGGWYLNQCRQNAIKIHAFLDINQSLQGTKKDEVPIVAPNEVLSNNDPKPYIIICVSKYAKKIRENLLELGYLDKYDFCIPFQTV